MLEEIIAPIDKEILKEELNSARLLRHARKGGNDIYIFTAHQCPNLMREVGRLREIAFREAGGGTGLACDIDEFDTMDEPYWQLIVWNPQDEQILKSTTSTNTAHAWLHDNKLSPCYVVGWADTEEASKWKIVPTGEQLTAILNVADETKNESLKFYDLTGRQLLHAPATGIYISSDRKKRLAR